MSNPYPEPAPGGWSIYRYEEFVPSTPAGKAALAQVTETG